MKKFKHSEITPEKIYNKRRSFIKSMGYGFGALTLNSVSLIISEIKFIVFSS